ncbi:MAG: hypothetical protein ACQETP_00955 [Bacteroidota bacterium]
MPSTTASFRSPKVADLASSTVDAARALFAEHFDADAEDPTAIYQQAPLAVQADHTHYSEGFALFAGLPHGVAITARLAPNDVSRLAETGAPARVALPPNTEARPTDSVTARVVRALLGAASASAPALDLAVAHTLPDTCRDAYVAALARAVHRMLLRLTPEADAPPFAASFVEVAQSVLPDAYGRPYSAAYPLAVSAAAHSNGHLAPFVLTDTPEHEALSVPTEHNNALQWGFFAPDPPPQYTPEVSERRHQRTQAALNALRATDDFAELQTFSALEHRALDRALDQIASEHHAVVRHLVTENRRVQKHVVALRHGDGQMSGALLHMTHASLQTTWDGASAAANFLVEQAKGYTEDGLYGAGMTGRDGYVLTIGRRPAYPAHIRTLRERYEATFHHPVSFTPL